MLRLLFSQRFLEATLAFNKGTPVLNDAEYDALKLKLKEASSPVAMAGPRCSLRSQRVYSDSKVDYLRMTLLNVPGALPSRLVSHASALPLTLPPRPCQAPWSAWPPASCWTTSAASG